MKSRLPKAAQLIAGRPMLRHLIATAEQVFDHIVVVIGPDMPRLEPLAAPHPTVVQSERRGTAHAALQAADHFGDELVAILYADNPLITAETLRELVDRMAVGDARLVLLATTPPEPGRYGRLIGQGDYITRIVEYADATEAERAIPLCNAGAMMARATDMAVWLAAVQPFNRQNEFYLTDIVAIAREEGAKVAAVEAPFDECLGINSRADLAGAEAVAQRRLRAAALDAGTAMVAPETVFFAADTELGAEVTIGPHVVFGPGVHIGDFAEIKAFSHLESCSVAQAAIVGPYARLRPGAEIGAGAHVGNFVEIKATKLGAGAKANHLSYLGDAEIGAGTNIGAGTVTCNYDGRAKHHTRIGAGAFIGSNTALVAPVSVGDGATVAAGSTITDDVPADTLAFGRARQVNKKKR